ncbi:hypothetical protein [Pseudomonas aeruginosa]|uniref:hypothetical protein n=1 Tax=Pseudomonas aeruginosa TaxID=287 RepID=UPI000FC41CD2|nr:hypothetical protein [Pseudomonas aeruginosa]RUI34567.1 hypothetical protein IPC443_03565 [Pseudomonas aeruginosa]
MNPHQTVSPLKVLTPELAVRLRTFNDAARLLQRMGVRLHRLEPVDNRLTIGAEDARRLLEKGYLLGFQRDASAGSTRYITRFQGVTLAWSEPISYRDFAGSKPVIH